MKTAHINDLGEKQSVKEHLSGTAERAEQFAESFGCGGAGYLCGICMISASIPGISREGYKILNM